MTTPTNESPAPQPPVEGLKASIGQIIDAAMNWRTGPGEQSYIEARADFQAMLNTALAVADREAIAGEFEPVGTQYLHYSPFTGHEVWLDRDFYNGHRATVSREVFARKSALALLHPQPAKGERP